MNMYAFHHSIILLYASRLTWTKNSVSYKCFYSFPLRHEMKDNIVNHSASHPLGWWEFHAGKYFVLKLLMLLLGSILLQLQWESGCANQPSLLTHPVQTMWWATIDAGLHDWIVWTNVSQGDRVLTVCPWEVHACNMSQDQSLLHKCAWTDGDFKNRSHWNLSNMSDKSLMWTEVPHKRPL